MWQDLHAELAPFGFTIVAVALDGDPEAGRPWAEAAHLDFPVLIDRDHVVADLYGLVNVPTVVWIDEAGRVVRPAEAIFGDNAFIEFHGVDSLPKHDELRRWVRDGVVPLGDDEAAGRTMAPTDDELRGRAHHRLALHLRRAGRADAAEGHFARAGELAPVDWTIRRGSMPLRGLDPFGEPYLELAADRKRIASGLYRPRG